MGTKLLVSKEFLQFVDEEVVGNGTVGACEHERKTYRQCMANRILMTMCLTVQIILLPTEYASTLIQAQPANHTMGSRQKEASLKQQAFTQNIQVVGMLRKVSRWQNVKRTLTVTLIETI